MDNNFGMLFDDNRTSSTIVDNEDQPENGLPTTESEIVYTIKRQSNDKAVDPDKIQSEVLRTMVEKDGAGLDLLTPTILMTVRVC